MKPKAFAILQLRRKQMDLPDIEMVAEKVHEAWMESKRKQGITSRKSEFGEEQMVPYSELSEQAKELDRSTVRAVYAAIEEVSRSMADR
jgi:hypothetical protein